jgi:tetratricopeptide (TPR) repeat protein
MIKICFSLLVLFYSNNSYAQSKKEDRKYDSALYKLYVDSLNNCTLYSQKRQRYLDSLLILDHYDSYWWQQKAMPLYKLKKYEIAKPFLDSAVKYDKTYHWTEYRGFMNCIFQKNYAEAIVDFKAVELLNPNGLEMDHSYNFYIGLSYLQLNQFDKAFLYAQKSIAYSENQWGKGHYLEYMYAGIIKMELLEYENAIAYLDKALMIFSNFSDAKYYKAICLRKLKKDKESYALIKEALKDLKNGYTINEDNALYEDYPYQVRLRQLEMFAK